MTETIPVIYIKCSSCAARNHCETCGRELSEALSAKPGITAAGVDIPNKRVTVTHTLDPDALEDALDAMGLLLG